VKIGDTEQSARFPHGSRTANSLRFRTVGSTRTRAIPSRSTTMFLLVTTILVPPYPCWERSQR
jgi:hypothetical protein